MITKKFLNTDALNIKDNTVVLGSGKSKYKVAMIYENESLMTLPVIAIQNKTVAKIVNELENKIKEIVEFADIGDFILQPVKTYSSGMYIRLAFAVAINVDADIILIDEALAVGDLFFRQKCYAKLNQLKEQGKTIILVTHAMG